MGMVGDRDCREWVQEEERVPRAALLEPGQHQRRRPRGDEFRGRLELGLEIDREAFGGAVALGGEGCAIQRSLGTPLDCFAVEESSVDEAATTSDDPKDSAIPSAGSGRFGELCSGCNTTSNLLQ
jgi:hypothetical protein